MAAKKISRRKPQNGPGRDGIILASSCTVGDIVGLDGKLYRLTAINDQYGILRASDAIDTLLFIKPDCRFESREAYVPRHIFSKGADPLKGEE